jgi:DNA-binding NtrC family response regulator
LRVRPGAKQAQDSFGAGDGVQDKAGVLIIDDDPTHLRIYGWIIAQAGFEVLPALVSGDRIDYPQGRVDLVVLDYRLTGQMSAVEAAEATKRRYPEAPIIVLSDEYDLPADIAPYVQAFVRKGEPAKLVATLAGIPKRMANQPDSAA